MKGAFLAMMVAAGVFGGEAAGQDGVPGLGKILSYQLDISRCKVPKMETVYRIVDILSSLGYNQFQLYMEHTFAYPQHEVVRRPRVGRSASEIERIGAERVYLSFLKRIHRLVTERGRVMMFWGDIILNRPELIPELPDDIICLNWGYEADHPYESQTAAFERAKRRFIVCPGTSAWSSLFGRTDNMMGNIDNAVTAGGRHGADGVMVADWGDGGHPNPWLTSVPGIVYAAHRVKGVRLSRTELAAKLDAVLGCRCGEALLAYGDVYRKCRGRMGNSTELYYLLREGKDYRRRPDVTDETLAAALAQARHAKSLADLAGAPEWVRDDFAMLDLLARAVEARIADPARPNLRAQFEPEYRRLWLKQNRLGGLGESLNQLFGIYL